MIHIQVRGEEIGFGVMENGNVGVYTLDRLSQIMTTIEFTPEAWKRFMEQAPRLKGVGIAGLAPIVVPGNDKHGA